MLSIGVDYSLTAQDLLLLVTMQSVQLFTTRYFVRLLFPLETIEIGAVPDMSYAMSVSPLMYCSTSFFQHVVLFVL